jgi:methionyl-tRNA synthetase
MRVADQANQKWNDAKPWLLAKAADTDAAKRTELKRVCTDCLYTFFALGVYLKPIVPGLFKKVAEFFEVNDDESITFGHLSVHMLSTRLPRSIRPYEHLATRIDSSQIDAMIEASKENLQPAAAPATPVAPTPTPQATAATISIDDFAKMDLRVGTVLECGFVDGSDKLLRFLLDAGELGQRQIFSGIRAAYQDPEKLVGRKVVFIANLAPRKMRFGMSEGMILSAGAGGADLHLLDADAGAKAGMPVK